MLLISRGCIEKRELSNRGNGLCWWKWKLEANEEEEKDEDDAPQAHMQQPSEEKKRDRKQEKEKKASAERVKRDGRLKWEDGFFKLSKILYFACNSR